MATKKKDAAQNADAPGDEDSSHNDEESTEQAGEEDEKDEEGEKDEQDEQDEAEVLSVKDSVHDKDLVARSVAWIRDRLNETVARGQFEIGQYLLKEFFGDDPKRVSSRDPNKNASFRYLAKHCGVDLPVSKSWLHNAVGVAVMQRSLPEGTSSYKKLPHSHQVALLPIHEPEKVEKLAEKVLEKRLPIGKLKSLVATELSRKPPDARGRKPTPEVLKALTHSVRLFTLDEGKSFTKTHVNELSDDQKKVALKAARRLAASLAKLIEYLSGE